MSKMDRIFDVLHSIDNSTLVCMWNTYQAKTSKQKVIYNMADDFDIVMSDYTRFELAIAVCESTRLGEFNDNHDYFEIINNRILHSFNDAWGSDHFSFVELAEYSISANTDMGIDAIRKILNEPEIPEYDFKFIIKCKRRTDNVANTMINLKDYIEIQTAGEYDMEVAGCDITKVE